MRRRLIGLLALAMVLGWPPPGAAAGGGKPGTVWRDAYGVAHITARSERDLLFLQGWQHAADRLFQMDVSRRQASGTLAELLGQPALPGDVEARTIGLRRAAERGLPAHSAEMRKGLEAYAAGVNAWVAGHPLPAQYAAVRITRFAPWTPVDSLVIGKAIAFNLSFDLDIELTLAADAYARAGVESGFDGAALFRDDLFRSQPFSAASTVPDATRRAARAEPGLSDAARRLARDYQARAQRTPLLADAVDRTFTLGSNEWAIAGRHTTTGRPILANDPHLSLTAPATFYPVALKGGGIDVQGESFAGAPYVILGQNRRVAWGATTNPMDVTDTYVERLVPDPASPSGLSTVYQGRPEPVVAIPETFRVNARSADATDTLVTVPPGGDVPAATLIVPRRNNGPIVSLDRAAGTALSVQYTGFSATRELEASRLINLARGVDDVRRALDFFDVGSQNWAVTDVAGHIAYFTSAEMPLREDLEAGAVRGRPPYFLRDGTGGNEWLPATRPLRGQAVPYAILPPAEMPHVVDPPAGFFVNANNDPAGTTLDNDPLNQRRRSGGIYYLNVGYDGFRAGRITELVRSALARGGKVSARDVQDQQADVTLLDAEFFRPHLVRALARARGSDSPELAALAADRRVVEAVGRLARWDCTTPTGIPEGYDAADVAGHRRPPSRTEVAHSVAASIYAVWRGQYVRNVIDARLAPHGLPEPGGPEALKALRMLLERFPTRHGVGASGIDFYAVPGVADAADRRDVLLLRSLADALDLLAGPSFAAAFGGSTRQDDYRWGRLHRVTFGSPLGAPWSIPPAGGAFPAPLPDLPGVPVDGGFGTVDAASHNVRADSATEFTFGGGPVRRAVAQPTRTGITAVSSLPGGTSETLGSPYYLNLLPRWLTNETYPVLMNGAR
ncbi:penicillin acylase family protein [Asanoa sp. WMMD1127]|uniref:penicillin acylase family protein n=1 Tax=Asanoa sp. WMMD1127 TaxID=3016107 RepID=UPI002416AABD|nr:penicillin acylase family protein [Asanoa sp. WMMD1127]MDG4825419.1 penicillin acylase family protein [Asanoa sp. WMMD1127]